VPLSTQCIMFPNFILTLKSHAITVYKVPNHIIQSHHSFQTPHIIFILQNIIIISIYSKVLKSSKTDIFSIHSWSGFIKQHIYFAILHYIKIVVLNEKNTHHGCIGLLTQIFPWILVTRTLHWRTNRSLQS